MNDEKYERNNAADQINVYCRMYVAQFSCRTPAGAAANANAMTMNSTDSARVWGV